MLGMAVFAVPVLNHDNIRPAAADFPDHGFLGTGPEIGRHVDAGDIFVRIAEENRMVPHS